MQQRALPRPPPGQSAPHPNPLDSGRTLSLRSMPHAIRIYENGGPEVLRLEELDPGKPAAGEVQIRHTAIGVNYIDVYDRTGLYPVSLPSGLGREAAGIVTALGRRVRGLRVGERV